MAKVVCESCGTSYKYETVKDMVSCPVCGEPLWGQESEENDTPAHDEELSFGDGIELGENDSFDEDKIDFWWYSIREPGEVWEGITFKRGDVSTNCAKCGHELKNHIISKRPKSWVDPRQRDMWEKDYDNLPKCPICHSTKIHKISMTNKVVSALSFGVLAAGHVSKTYKCDVCSSKF